MKESPSVTARLVEIAPLRLFGWLALAAWFFQHWLSHPYSIGGGHDWTYFTHHQTAAYRSYVDYGELPVWDPWFCGGIPGLGNLQNNAFSPSLLFGVLFGLMPGVRLATFLYFVLGLEGAYQCARHHGTRGLGGVVAGILFALSGRFVQPFVDGQPVFMGFALAPWIVLSFEKGFHSRVWAMGLGGFMCAVFLEGGAVTTPLLTILLALLWVLHTLLGLARRDGSWWRPTHSLVIAGALASVVSAPRLFPVLENLYRHPRQSVMVESFTLSAVWDMLTAAPKNVGYFSAGSAHIGLFAIAGLLFAAARYDRVALGYLAMTVLLVDLTLGYQPGLGLYEFVKGLPVLGNIRNPFRFTYLVALYLALGAGRALALVESDIQRLAESPRWLGWLRRLRHGDVAVRQSTLVLGLVCLVFGAAHATSLPVRFNKVRLDRILLRAPPLARDGDFRQSLGNRWHAHVWSAVNLGSIGCFEEQPFFTSDSLRGDLAAEEYLLDPEAGSVRRLRWSPHSITLDVELTREATVLVNQNAHRAWSVSPGFITEYRGLLAARVPAGHHTVVFRHRDVLVTAGFLTLALAAGLLGGRYAWRRWGRKSSTGALGAHGPPATS